MLELNCSFFSVRRVHLVVEAVETLPLFGGYFFADLAGVFARSVDATGYGDRMMLVEDQRFSAGGRVASPFKALRIPKGSDEALPMGFGAGTAGVEHEAHSHVELAHGVFGALEVAAHPIEAVGNARKHLGTLPNPELHCGCAHAISLSRLRFPQGLKPGSLCCSFGTSEVLP